MTPKEKAKELVGQFRMILMDEDTDCGHEILCTSIAIKNALICIDEIINSSPSIPILSDCGSFGEDINLSTKYWKKVKKEIKNYK